MVSDNAEQGRQQDENRSTAFSVKPRRRQLLKASIAGILGGSIGLSGTTGVAVGQEGRGTIFEEDFEQYSVGSYPDGWTQAGNSDQEVVDSPVSSGSQAFRMSGNPGGCWEAISHHPVSLPETGVIQFSGQIRPTSEGEVGCHSGTQGHFLLRTSAAREPYPGGGIRLFSFHPDGEIWTQGADQGVFGSYQRDTWHEFAVEYRRRADEVTHTFWLNGEERGSVTRAPADFESDLSAISLQSGEFTVYWDQFQVRAGSSADPRGRSQGTGEGEESGEDEQSSESGFSGVARSPFGDRLEGVEVALYDNTMPATADANPVATATSNADGRFEIAESLPSDPAIIAVQPRQNLFFSISGFTGIDGELTIELSNQLLFGPTVANSERAAVSVWRRILSIDPQYQVFYTEVIPAPYDSFLQNCGFGMSFPEDIDVRYDEEAVTDHPYSSTVRILSHITSSGPSSQTLDRYPPEVTGVPVYPVVSIGDEAYQYEPERRQNRQILNQAAMDIFSATPILGTALSAVKLIGDYSDDTEKGTVAAGSRPEPANRNQSDTVTDVFTVKAEALVFQVPVKVTETTGQIQCEASWVQAGVTETQVFGHQQDVAFMEL